MPPRLIRDDDFEPQRRRRSTAHTESTDTRTSTSRRSSRRSSTSGNSSRSVSLTRYHGYDGRTTHYDAAIPQPWDRRRHAGTSGSTDSHAVVPRPGSTQWINDQRSRHGTMLSHSDFLNRFCGMHGSHARAYRDPSTTMHALYRQDEANRQEREWARQAQHVAAVQDGARRRQSRVPSREQALASYRRAAPPPRDSPPYVAPTEDEFRRLVAHQRSPTPPRRRQRMVHYWEGEWGGWPGRFE